MRARRRSTHPGTMDRARREEVAWEEVEDVLRNLPPEVKRHAGKIPVVMEDRPNELLVRDDVEPDTLGLFVGGAYPHEQSGVEELPAQILLFLENIWDYAEHRAGLYRREVRRTLLHEIGHYLGLDEEDLLSRDLD